MLNIFVNVLVYIFTVFFAFASIFIGIFLGFIGRISSFLLQEKRRNSVVLISFILTWLLSLAYFGQREYIDNLYLVMLIIATGAGSLFFSGYFLMPILAIILMLSIVFMYQWWKFGYLITAEAKGNHLDIFIKTSLVYIDFMDRNKVIVKDFKKSIVEDIAATFSANVKSGDYIATQSLVRLRDLLYEHHDCGNNLNSFSHIIDDMILLNEQNEKPKEEGEEPLVKKQD